MNLLKLRAVPSGTVLSLRTTAEQKRGVFRGGLVFKAHGLLFHSTLGSSAMNKRKKVLGLRVCSTCASAGEGVAGSVPGGTVLSFRTTA